MDVETDALLPIGRFAQATGLTVRALRHYAALGLLPPARVDERTGYRYYALAQLHAAAAIARLRALDVPLGEIRHLVGVDDAMLRAGLAEHRKRLAEHASETRRLIDELDRVIDGEESLVPEETVPELTVEDVPACTYVIARERAPMEELTRVIPRLIAETHAWVLGHGGSTGAPMAVVGPPDDEGVVGLEVGWPVEGLPEPPAPLETVTYEATRAVVHRHVGPYERLHETYGLLEHAIAAARLVPAGPARESYETNPEEEPDPERWITEIVWPVA